MAGVAGLHPVTRLIGWSMLLVLVQCLHGWALAAAIVLLPLLGRSVLGRAGRLIRRARWLLITLFAVFAWGTAGEPFLDIVGAPTREGLHEGGTHLGRMLLIFAAVAALLEYMPLDAMLSASNHLLRPLHRFGCDAERAALRLQLVLRYVETLPRPRDWRTLLQAPPIVENEVVVLESRALRGVDYVCLLLGACVMTIVCFRSWGG